MSSPGREIPAPLCGHAESGQALERAGRTARCSVCASFWDLDSLVAKVRYDASYLDRRGHAHERTGELKFRSLTRWLASEGIDVSGLVVCEVGFGAGYVLRGIARRGGVVSGVEANPAAREAARALGLAPERLHLADRLPARLDPRVDLWLFLDSFEHLPNPAEFLAWLTASSSPRALALVVAPDAASPSARWLGRAWPHRLADHAFHWSRRGLTDLWSGRGWTLRSSFRPTKLVSPAMLVAHAVLMLRVGGRAAERVMAGARALDRIALPFNIGELGLVFANGQAVGHA